MERVKLDNKMKCLWVRRKRSETKRDVVELGKGWVWLNSECIVVV